MSQEIFARHGLHVDQNKNIDKKRDVQSSIPFVTTIDAATTYFGSSNIRVVDEEILSSSSSSSSSKRVVAKGMHVDIEVRVNINVISDTNSLDDEHKVDAMILLKIPSGCYIDGYEIEVSNLEIYYSEIALDYILLFELTEESVYFRLE